MKATMWDRGIAALLAALMLGGCVQPLDPSFSVDAGRDIYLPFGAGYGDAPSVPGQLALGGQIEPYTVEVSLGEDGSSVETELPAPVEAESPADADAESFSAARSVAGPTINQINNGDNIRNYLQLIAVDKADGTIASFHEARKASASQSLGLKISGLVSGHTYGVLLLQGHWERDYAAETGGKYAYTNSPPTLLSTGYTELTYTSGAGLRITVWPMYVDTVFTTPGGLRTEPAVNAGKPRAVNLAAAAWDVNWKILRGSNGKLSGLDDLLSAQNAVGGGGYGLAARSLKVVVWTAAPGTADAPAFDVLDTLTFTDNTLTGNTVTLPLADYTGLPSIGASGAVNFALHFVPFNVTEGWAKHDASSVFDLSAGPPEWVIRGGLNDLAQDDNTDFARFGKKPVTQANGNGAVRFTVAAPQAAAAGELVASDGTRTDSSITFTASGYAGTARAWYAVVFAGDAAPGYYAYTPLGDTASGTYTKTLMQSANAADGGGSSSIAPMAMAAPQGAAAGIEGTPVALSGKDVYVVLVKDGKVGAPHKISDFPLTNVEEARAYLAAHPHGDSPDDPVPLPVKLDLAVGGEDSLENLFELIAEKRKYVDLDLSLCTPVSIKSEPESGTESESEDGTKSEPENIPAFDPRSASGAGKSRVVSLVLPDTAQIIPAASDGSPAFKDFTFLKTVRGSHITSIGAYAFQSCASLTQADFPNAAAAGAGAFENCISLTQVNLPGAADIGEAVFRNCSALEEIGLPAAVSIGVEAFWGCTALTAVSLPLAASIGEAAFLRCAALEKADLKSAAYIGYNAFLETGAKPLTITLGVNAPVIGIGPYSSAAVYAKAVTVDRPDANADYNAAWQAAFKEQLFGAGANITLNSNREFFDFLLTSAAEVRRYLAADPRGGSPDEPVPLLVQVDLGSAVGSLANLLKQIEAAGKYVVLNLSRCSMYGTAFNTFPTSGAGKNLVVGLTLPDAAKSFLDVSADTRIFKHFTSLEAILGRNVTDIGSYTFGDCASLVLADFPAATSIDRYAFADHTALRAVNFPAATHVGDYAFRNCTALEEVNLPAATNLDSYAFQNCTSPFTLNAPELRNIGDGAFRESGIKGANFPNITEILPHAFEDCTSLQAVRFPAVTHVGAYAFAGCTALKGVELPAVDNGGIKEYAFARCTSLEYVDLSFWEPDQNSKGLFYETGPTPLTIRIDPLEGNEAFGSAYIHENYLPPSHTPYDKQVMLATTDTTYVAAADLKFTLMVWFGENANLAAGVYGPPPGSRWSKDLTIMVVVMVLVVVIMAVAYAAATLPASYTLIAEYVVPFEPWNPIGYVVTYPWMGM